MSPVSPEAIRAEQHEEIANLTTSNVGIILERWERRAAEEQPPSQRVQRDVLRDHLTELLRTLGNSLAATGAAEALQHTRPAADHGEQRFGAGWSLTELIRDYQILRLVLLEFLEESLDRALRYREVLAINLALDEAITVSVVIFVRERDEYLASLEKKRLEELQKVQEQLRIQAESLLQADRQKNEFLAVLAHELRNPLAPVRHAVQVLKLKHLTDADLQWASAVIERQTQQLARMIDDLSDISRIAHGKVKLEKEIVLAAALMQRAVEEVQPLMDARKHRLHVAVPAAPIWVEADPQRLTQVLVNLLINAAKYTDEGGEIHLSAERLADEVVLKVRDNGIGIPAHMLRRIFEPFMQEQQTEDRVQGGLGIGLALVRKLIDLHGGRVQAFSGGRGAGSEFVIHLPALSAAPSSPTAPPKIAATPPTAKRRILVVDDNRDAANALAVLLRLIGHEVQVAHDGPSALDNARANPPEIILLDIGMPRMNGFEVGRRLRQDLGLTTVLLVALTGYGQDQDRKRSHEAGFDMHLVKPIELSHLYGVLQQMGQSDRN